MADKSATYRNPTFTSDVIVIVGGFGSGKSEVSVNLARQLDRDGSKQVSIADLDIINPYFRSREAAEELRALGIRPLIPPGDQVYADLPIVIPQIKGAIEEPEGILILDVGGNDQGARVLSSLADAFSPDNYELLLVHNANRPFTADVESTGRMMDSIESASRLKFTGLISNTHLMDGTTAEIVIEGLRLARRVGQVRKIPVAFVSATDDIVKKFDPQEIDLPVLRLNRSLLKPWENRI